jgi:hypothetical protein
VASVQKRDLRDLAAVAYFDSASAYFGQYQKKRLQPGGKLEPHTRGVPGGRVRHNLDVGDGWTIPTYIMV